jgi:hypothetical protein
MLREILRHNPPLEARDTAHDGTALDWALHGSVNGWHVKSGDFGAVVTALLEAGATRRDPSPAVGSDAAHAAYQGRSQRSGGSAA